MTDRTSAYLRVLGAGRDSLIFGGREPVAGVVGPGCARGWLLSIGESQPRSEQLLVWRGGSLCSPDRREPGGDLTWNGDFLVGVRCHYLSIATNLAW